MTSSRARENTIDGEFRPSAATAQVDIQYCTIAPAGNQKMRGKAQGESVQPRLLKLVTVAMSLKRSQCRIICTRMSTNPENLVKINQVYSEIIGLI